MDSTGTQHNDPSAPSTLAPRRTSSNASFMVPESFRDRLKTKILGPPLVTERMSEERLSNPVALGVLAPDMISSSAYGTEQMLAVMIPIIGFGAFTMVIPVTIAILAVLFFVTISYIDVIKYYTKAGGSYVVARDNFGPKVAQIAAVALLIDYIVTVAVQSSAGTNALVSAAPTLAPYTLEITVGIVLLLLYGNLRGIREAGGMFAFPVYFFVFCLASVVIYGVFKEIMGTLEVIPMVSPEKLGTPFGTQSSGMLMGLGAFYLLKAFANGGSSLTGLEAVSNGISSFKKPESRNGRNVLIIMCCTLGFLVLGVTMLAHWTHAVPYASGNPTVVSQEVKAVLGSSIVGHIGFWMVQIATMLILWTGANTSFNGFPFLANFVAGDSFLPRQLTKRGHRLAFSNGIIVLAIVAIILIIAFDASVNSLVALYAIGVFTGFTIAGAGMVKHHRTAKVGKWQRGVAINGFSALLSFSVVIILLVTKFTEGAWVIAFVAPPMYYGLIRLNREYKREAVQLEVGAAAACEAPVLRRHVVVVLVDQLDMAAARAIQYARSLRPDELRVVHFDIDTKAAATLKDEWGRLGLARLTLDITECRDRRIDRAVVELTAEIVADHVTECTLLIPRRSFNSRLGRLLHDRTADQIAAAIGPVEHVSATIIPFNVKHASRSDDELVSVAQGASEVAERHEKVEKKSERNAHTSGLDRALAERSAGTVSVGDLEWRKRARVAGRVRSLRVQTAAGTQNLECILTDDTGNLLIVFQGRPKIPGIEAGSRLVVEGMVGSWKRQMAMLNPDYELIGGTHE